MAIRKLGELLPKFFHPSVVQQLEATAVCDAGEAVVRQLFPADADRIRVLYFKKGDLYIGTPSSVISAEIVLRKEKILRAIHAHLRKEDVVKDIQVR